MCTERFKKRSKEEFIGCLPCCLHLQGSQSSAPQVVVRWLFLSVVKTQRSGSLLWSLVGPLCVICTFLGNVLEAETHTLFSLYRSWTNHCCGFKIKRLFKPPLAQPQLWASVYLYWLSNNRYTDCAQQIRIKIAKLEKILAQNRFEYERE